MNKTDFIRAVGEKAGFTNKDAHTFLDAFIAVTTEALAKGEEISLTGFGSFSVAKRGARTGMNFKTKKPIDIPASKGIKFKAGKNLKEAVQ